MSIEAMKATKAAKRVVKKSKPTMVEEEAKEVVRVSSRGR